MADQTAMNDAVTKAVAQATRATVQTMVELCQGPEDQKTQSRQSSSEMLQFNWMQLINTQDGRHSSWR